MPRHCFVAAPVDLGCSGRVGDDWILAAKPLLPDRFWIPQLLIADVVAVDSLADYFPKSGNSFRFSETTPGSTLDAVDFVGVASSDDSVADDSPEMIVDHDMQLLLLLHYYFHYAMMMEGIVETAVAALEEFRSADDAIRPVAEDACADAKTTALVVELQEGAASTKVCEIYFA